MLETMLNGGPYVRAFAPGRTEIAGNHVDHQGGLVVAAAITQGITAVACPNGTGIAQIESMGFDPVQIDLTADLAPRDAERGTVASLVRGMAALMRQQGVPVTGFDLSAASTLAVGGGLSSSAAFELLLGQVMNALFARGSFDAPRLALMGQQAEWDYFGKPCGLMDQMSIALGGMVRIDFSDARNPSFQRLTRQGEPADLAGMGLDMVLVDCGASHEGLTGLYASIPQEMQAVARLCGGQRLRDVTLQDVMDRYEPITRILDDRSFMRALHYFRENESTACRIQAITSGDADQLLRLTMMSGASSAQYLQNVSAGGPSQPAAVTMAVVDTVLDQLAAANPDLPHGACRIHGGGFGGGIQVLVPSALAGQLTDQVNDLLERDACLPLSISPDGAWAQWEREAAQAPAHAAPQGDIRWQSPTAWGTMDITINLTKPEKDPRAIAAAAKDTGHDCVLCRQNLTPDGWLPEYTQAARAFCPDLRMGSVAVDGPGTEPWLVQYSPYHYFEKHCIAASPDHVPMAIDRRTFVRLLRLVDAYPGYVFGSNADLPIVGGSILAHDHFQGGCYEFPMDRAPLDSTFALGGFDQVSAGFLKWPVSTIRLECPDLQVLADAAARVLAVWRGYSDSAAGIIAADEDGTPHNTVTPIARRLEGTYRLDLALRCNITDDEHPLGVFHPHAGLHHVKKENIGLIEVMGLAILPPRLRDMLDSGQMTRQQIADAFAQVLECTGVFKWDGEGAAARSRFIGALWYDAPINSQRAYEPEGRKPQ